MDKKTFYITTPIYYPSGKFHIGTAYTTTLADTIKRYKKMRGYDAYLLTGLDEHGQKVQTVAENRGLTPKAHVDEMAKEAKKLWSLMEIDYDQFIRTTDEKHEEVVTKVVEKFVANGDIYKGKYEDRLIKFYEENPHFIEPEFRRNEIFSNFIKPGLEDLCISRTTFDWGIKMKNDPKHVLYVWVDALTNYISALGYLTDDDSLFRKYWPADLHIVAKDIIRFHGIYWPIFLMALGLELPKKIYAHGYIVMKDGKMSKSKGNVIYPEDLIGRYGLDATKYYLLREMSFGQDSVFTPEVFVERYNFDLCNDLGNLLNRTIGMINKYFDGVISSKEIVKTEYDSVLEEFTQDKIKEVEKNMDSYHISNAIAEIWSIIARTNKYIDETEPWKLSKEEESNLKLKSVMYHLVENLRKIAILIRPFMQDTSNRILSQLGIENENLKTWESLHDYKEYEDNLKVINKGEPLFIRLEKDEEIDWIKEKMKK